MGESTAGFRGRARFEADRHGSDRWVFVRELLQNARDAGATQVSFSVEGDDARDRISCRDDGCGMTFEHARRYLFTLYASSKRHDKRAAGRFGIGFWSVLRFEPEAISVRSRPANGHGWEVILDGSLNTASVAACVMLPGTEIVIERAAGDRTVEAEVVRVIRGDARFLRLRDDPQRRLEVTVNGRPVTAEFGLPPPSLEFRRPGVRGAVALADEPGVEVFAHGLRVRRAAFLDELLTGDDVDRRPSAELPEGLVPNVLLDSDRLRVLMARGEAREDRVLRRLVGRARRELARLVRIELDRRTPLNRLERIAESIAAAGRVQWVRWIGGAVMAGGVVGGLVGLGFRGTGWSVPGFWRGEERPAVVVSPSVRSSADPVRQYPYSDLAASYGGPTVDVLDHQGAVDLSYRPESAFPLFTAIRLTGLEVEGLPQKGLQDHELVAYRGSPCIGGCLEVEVGIAAPRGVLRLPVVTGHRIDPTSVRLDGEPIEVRATPAGEPAVFFKREIRGRLRYRSAPSRDMEALPVGRWPRLPDLVARRADRMLALPVAQRVAEAEESVRSWIAYDRSPVVASRHDDAAAAGMPVFERSLAIGAGDCDVQNALLAAILDRAGVPSRLVVGFVGLGGRAKPGLHAWVEYLEDGVWHVADASAGSRPIVPLAEPSTAAPAIVSMPSASAQAAADVAPGVLRPGSGRVPVEAGIVALAVALVVLILGGILASREGRWSRRVIASDEGADLARLLRGALLRPQAYANVGALYARPLVPTVGGRALSLRRAQRFALSRGLYQGNRRSRVARDAADRGVAVIDAGSAEGRVVADLLGARDLDSWEGLLDRSRSTPLTRRLEAAAARRGERWSVSVARDAPAAVAVHEGEPLGLTRLTRVVVFAEEGRLWQAAETLDSRSGWAALMLASSVVDELEIAPPVRTLVLGDLARQALREQLR